MTTSTDTSGMEFEVFLSFRGSDTRNSFTSCLYHDMVEKGIRVFKDDKELQVGDKIEKLLKALDDSQIYIPIFSQDFASSSWCLDEVARMVDRTSKSDGKKEILPLFFDVKPEDVKLRTELYSNALSKHEEKYGPDEVKRWRDALREVATRVGWRLEGKEQGELMKTIVREVLLKLKVKNRSLPDKLVVRDDEKDIEKLLEVDSADHARFIIIHGAGGIGKTTLAGVIFNRFQSKFLYSSFLEDVHGLSERYGLLYVQKKLLSDILGSDSVDQIQDTNHGMKRISDGLCNKKVLIVIDNVNEKEQLDKLAGSCRWFGPGSKIIVTVRDRRTIRDRTILDEDNHTGPSYYMEHSVNEMPVYQAIQLFSKHALRCDYPPIKWRNFSEEVVSSIGRLPLTLEVVGSLFARTARQKWGETLKDLKQVPCDEVRDTLMISINKLDHRKKDIFLDIACFCIGEDKMKAYYMWDDCGYSPSSAIDDLLLMSLIKIDKDNKFRMHDEVRDLGRYIVKEENIEDVGGRRWVRIDENTLDILRSNKEKRAVRALSLDISHDLTPEELVHFPNLRFLGGRGLNFVGDFKNLCGDLRWLSWPRCPPDFRALNLHLVKLVVLNLSRSLVTNNLGGWSQIKMAKELKILDLNFCYRLTKTPDFSEFGKLEKLILANCMYLSKIDSSIGKLKLLTTLNILRCGFLKELPEEIGYLESLVELKLVDLNISVLPHSIGRLKSLEHLLLQGCKNLLELPESIGELEALVRLNLKYSGILILPDSIGMLKSLKHLGLEGCKNVFELPESIGELEALVELNLNCSGILVLPDSIERLKILKHSLSEGCNNLHKPPYLGSLVKLELDNLGISTLPDFMGRLTRVTHLSLSECKNLRELPDSIGQMELLVELDLKSSGITLLPNSIGNLKRLKVLNVAHTNIRTIPRALGAVETLEELDASSCPHLEDEIPWEMWSLTRLRILDLYESPISTVPRKIGGFSSLQTLKIASPLLSPLPELPSSLECLVVGAAEFPVLPDLSNLVLLRDLEVRREEDGLIFLIPYESPWKDPQSIDQLPPNLSTLKLRHIAPLPRIFDFQNLSVLSITECPTPRLPDLSRLKRLQELRLDYFPELVEIPGLGELESLTSLQFIECSVIEQLPNLSKLENLSRLELEFCRKLRAVEGLKGLKKLENAEIRSCWSLERLPDIPTSTKLKTDWTPPENLQNTPFSQQRD